MRAGRTGVGQRVRLACVGVVCAALVATAGAQRAADGDSDFLDGYIGRYQLTPTYELIVTRVEDAIYVRAAGQPPVQLVPRSRTEFVVVGGSLRVLFNVSNAGVVDHLMFEQGGFARRAEKVSAETRPDAARVAVALAPATLERYVGTYEEQPGFAIEITRMGDHLMARLTDQPDKPVLPTSDTEFHYTDSAGGLRFEVSPEGEVEALTFHHGGAELRMRRVD
jgi:hypothetical protein